jgi:hypothetical protein
VARRLHPRGRAIWPLRRSKKRRDAIKSQAPADIASSGDLRPMAGPDRRRRSDRRHVGFRGIADGQCWPHQGVRGACARGASTRRARQLARQGEGAWPSRQEQPLPQSEDDAGCRGERRRRFKRGREPGGRKGAGDDTPSVVSEQGVPIPAPRWHELHAASPRFHVRLPSARHRMEYLAR